MTIQTMSTLIVVILIIVCLHFLLDLIRSWR